MRVPTVEQINAIIEATASSPSVKDSGIEKVGEVVQDSLVITRILPKIVIQGVLRGAMESLFDALMFGMYLAYQLNEVQELEESVEEKNA